MFETIKAKVGLVFSLFTGLTTIVGAVFAVDSAFVRAADFVQFKTETARAIQQQGYDNQISVNILRKQQLEDKIFEIQLVLPEKRSQMDRARLEKYQRDLQEITVTNTGLNRSRSLTQ